MDDVYFGVVSVVILHWRFTQKVSPREARQFFGVVNVIFTYTNLRMSAAVSASARRA